MDRTSSSTPQTLGEGAASAATASHPLAHLFTANREWVADMVADSPDFFSSLAAQQKPEYLWIGCSDSRVPANQITGLAPGEVFVHRNIANVVVHTDLNCLSVMQFAIDVIKVKHIIVCGHYGCSGVHAAMTRSHVGLAANWLRHVEDVRERHESYLGSIANEKLRHDKLCELNVVEQVRNVCLTSIVQDAWARGQPLAVHGWVYGIQDGLLRDLRMTASAPGQVSAAFTASRERIVGA
jgi:carbonic anhydrase